MTTLIRPLGMTQTRQTLTLPVAGYSQTVQAYLWGGGGGSGGSDGPRLGGAGTGGGYVSAQFTVNPGDVVELTVGMGSGSGQASSGANQYETSFFNTRSAVPIGRSTPMPDASATYVASWSKFLNDYGVWPTPRSSPSNPVSLTFDQSYSVFFEFSINYVFKLAAYYNATVYLDDELLIESGLDSWRTQESGGVSFVRNIAAGTHTVRIVANAPPGSRYGVFGVALEISLLGNAGQGGGGLIRNVFDTRNTLASPPLSVQSPVQSSDGTYSYLMLDFGMWEQNVKAPSCSRTYSNVYFPYTGSYQVQMSAANTATLSIDGTVVYTTPGSDSYSTAYTTEVTVAQGYHTVSFTASYTNAALPAGGVAIVITKSWSGASGGLAGPTGSSGGGGGSGGATTLVLNPKTPNETLIAVAVGGAGGGGAGATTVGIGEATAPGPNGLAAAGISNAQAGQNQGDLYKDGGGGGAGGPGGPGGAGKNGFSSVGDSYGQAGTVGLGYLNPIATGTVVDPVNVDVAFRGPYYDLLPDIGLGGLPGSIQGNNGGAVFIFTSFGPRVHTAGGWQEVKTIFVNVNGVWQQTEGMYVNEAGVWLPVVGIVVPAFEPQSDDFGRLSRAPDLRALPPPPPKVFDSFFGGSFGGCCFVAGTMITMADGSLKRIEDVVIGDQVIGKDGAINTVQEYIRPLLGDRTLVGFNSGAPFITNDHPVLSTDGTWRSVDPAGTASKYAEANLDAGQLSVGDIVATGNGVGFLIESIEEHVHSVDLQVYNFLLDGNNTYIANNLVVHNKGVGAGCGAGGGGCCCCFVAGTMITMADGSYKRIEDVELGEVVLGKDSTHNTVLEFLRPTLGETGATLMAFNGAEPFMASDHPVWIRNEGWKSYDPAMTFDKYGITVSQYEVGNTIETEDYTGFLIESIEEYNNQDQTQTIYNLKVTGNNTYVANRLVVHNKSDARLKRNIELIETRDDGLQIYTFNYIWSDVTWVGVMAQDLLEQPQFAHAVRMDADGFYSVNYSKINFEMIRADMYCVES